MKTFAVGVSGATGIVLARRLIEVLLEQGHSIHLCASRAAKLVIEEELPARQPGERGAIPGLVHERLREWGERDFRAPFASGSADIAGMAVIPCSMSTVGAIANGIADNLIRRGAEVMLKERKPLVVVPREAPLSEIHLQNLLRVARAGGIVIPPQLCFYQRPGPDVAEQIDFNVSRVLDHLGIENQLYRRWDQAVAEADLRTEEGPSP